MNTNAPTFAGFPIKRKFALLPRKPLRARLSENKANGGRPFTSGYYGTPPRAEKRERVTFYLESDFAPGLRWKWADEVEGARIGHTGWWTDEHGIADTIRGFVMALPHGRGFLAGASMGEHMVAWLDRDVWDNARDAAHDADRMAERIAEDEREYQAQRDEDEDEGED